MFERPLNYFKNIFLRYRITKRKNNIRGKRDQYIMQAVHTGIVGFDEICKEAGSRSAMSPRDVKHAAAEIAEVVKIHLAQGRVVELGELGRPVQQIAHKQSGDGQNLVTHIEYDGYGRQVREYLPYDSGGSTLDYVSGAESGTTTFYSSEYGSSYGYSEKELENSPLGRVLRQAAPGDDWAMDSGHEIKFDYQTNSGTEVYYFKVNSPTSTPALALHNGNSGKYEANQLYKTITKDENWVPLNGTKGTVVEFKDKLGRIILKRHYNSTTGRSDDSGDAYDTYYVYDDFGNLTFVLPPKLSEQIVSGSSLVGNHQHLLDELGYRYTYDYRNRLIRKKLPGKRVEHIYYDSLDRVTKVGPVPNPFAGGSDEGFIHTKYDKFNRVVYTFWRKDGSTVINRGLEPVNPPLSESPKAGSDPTSIDGIDVYYTNNVIPTDDIKLLTVNYYDDYRFSWAPGTFPGSVLTQTVYYNKTTQKPKGLPTGTWVRVLEDASDTNATTTYTLYDKKSRAIRVHSNNYLGGYTTVDSQYDFSGKVLKTVTTHQFDANATSTEIEETFSYTAQDRLTVQTHEINSSGTKEQLLQNSYDALGQLITKRVGGQVSLGGGQSGLQKVDYTYNIRGWLTGINDVSDLQQGTDPVDLFAFDIRYTYPGTSHRLVTPLYNGNISRVYWRTASDNIRRSYGYSYDYLNRLLDAFYTIPGANVNDSYNEHLAYDKNGNITALLRNGGIEHATNLEIIDDLTYDYDDGNKLINVTDSGNPNGFKDGNEHTQSNVDDFEYDDYGNLIIDRNKNIDEIAYNHLHLPKKITVTGTGAGTIEYLYDANGVKVKKTVIEGAKTIVTDYLDGFQYVNETLEFFPHAEGYVKVTTRSNGAQAFNYVYNYTDHLGNIRLRYTEDPSASQDLAILEEDHYYPFGLKHKGYSGSHEIFGMKLGTDDIELIPVTTESGDPYKYKFNGKEYNEDLGINGYDFGARNYDPAIGRWMNIDPLAEDYYNISPYAYVANNPLMFVDPDGMRIDISQAQQYDKDNETNYVEQIINDLQSQTGLTFNISDDGFLEFQKDDDGNAIISKDEDGNEIGSSLARGAITKAINHDDTGNFTLVDSGGSHGEGLDFQVDVNEVNSFIGGTSSDLNNKTMGFGMMFTHELIHTDIGLGKLHGDEVSAWGKTGTVVNIMNSIRGQLGSDYGQRLSYSGFTEGGKTHLPFDSANKTHIYNRIIQLNTPLAPGATRPGFTAPSTGKFISY